MELTVAIDIETTGLDSDRDAIIEIGAVKFRGNRIEGEWSSLVNPNRHIPEFITNLTGIDDAMLRQAPRLREISNDIETFIGSARILGHSVRFDLGFLQKHIPLLKNEVIDTYELAAVLVPNAGRYNLGALGKELGVALPATHRALDDAKVTHAIFLRLLEIARDLPPKLVEELIRIGEAISWRAATVFRDVLQAGERDGFQGNKPRKEVAALLDHEPRQNLEIPEEPRQLDVEEIAAILEHGGPFSKYFGAFEYRREQVEMLRAVASAISQGRHLMVEAGTGVGKSFAYLIPAAVFALQNNTRVVISTNTINLQDQLIQKDIPDLQAALHLDIRASVLKGRANYLCPRRLENLKRFGPRNDDEMRVLAKVLVWQVGDSSGDRNSISLNGNAEREVWQRLSAEDDACTTETCIKRTGGACPFHAAKTASQSAHLLIVNHALLLSDVTAAGKVLPEYSYLVVDEAHHLESATTNALSFRLTQADLDRMLQEIGGTGTGLLGNVLTLCRGMLNPSDFGLLQQRIKLSTDLAFREKELNHQFFVRLAAFASELQETEPVSNYAWQARILPSTRTLAGWDPVEIAWDETAATLNLLAKGLSEIHETASVMYANGKEELEDVVADLSSTYRRLAEVEQNVSAMISKPSPEQVYWIDVKPNGGKPSLNAAPLNVGPLVEKSLWHEKASIILTSATLTTHGEFQYLRRTLGADEAEEMQVGSPFDYQNSTLIYVANDMPEPTVREYHHALSRALISTAKATGGRMLALFTSYAALKRAAQAITGPLAHEDIFVYEHGDGASPNMLLESFKSTERAVLLGTRSFWEGVDVPGAALSVLVITKLPFDVPTDPLIAARSELYEDPFQEYYLPEAILKFRQGFGRLIRSSSDRGVVVILDRRVLSKQYGQLFLESLPQCTSRHGPAGNLAREAARWLNM